MNDSTQWPKLRVLVTGGTGLLGKSLVGKLLALGARVFVMARKLPGVGQTTRIQYVLGDVADAAHMGDILAETSPDLIFHLAAVSQPGYAMQHPLAAFEVNAVGTWRLLEAVRTSQRTMPVVVASSEAVYREGEPTPFTEESPVAGSSPYAASKLAAEHAVQVYALTYGMPVCGLRTSNLFGPLDPNPNRLIPSIVSSCLEGESPILKSDGTPERDFLFVDDAADGYLAAGCALLQGRLGGQVLNVSSGVAISIRSLTETILALTGHTHLKPIVLGSGASAPSRRCSSSAKALALLRWQPQQSLMQGLEKTIAAFGLAAESTSALRAQLGEL